MACMTHTLALQLACMGMLARLAFAQVTSIIPSAPVQQQHHDHDNHHDWLDYIANISAQATTSANGANHDHHDGMYAQRAIATQQICFRAELPRLLKSQFVLEARDASSWRGWMADVHTATDELEAAYMVHDSLATHVATVRCPVYTMVFKWFQDERQNLDRARDVNKRVTRRLIQMLSTVVLLEPEFYHDKFFLTTFGSMVSQYISVAERIEREATHAGQMETWFDLVGCLYDYGDQPQLALKYGSIKQAMMRFIHTDTRRRLVMRMLRARGRRDRRLNNRELIRARLFVMQSKGYSVVAEISVEVIMDNQTRKLWRDHQRGSQWLARAANKQAWPLWPASNEPLQQYDPAFDLRPLPVLVGSYRSLIIDEWLASLDDLDRPAAEPSRLAVTPSRTRRDLLIDIAIYYKFRKNLIANYEQPAAGRPQLWTKLPLDSLVESCVVAKLLDNSTPPPTVDLDELNLLGDGLEMIRALTFEEPDSYEDIIVTIQLATDRLSTKYNVDLLSDVVNTMLGNIDLARSIKRLFRQVIRGSSSQVLGDELMTQAMNNFNLSEKVDWEDCAICIESLDTHLRDDSPLRREHFAPVELNCGHKFHWACVCEWFNSSPALARRCPLCRA